MKVLIDTNVLLDWLLKRTPFSVDAAQIVGLAELKRVDAHFAAITLTNAYYIAKVPRGAAFATSFVEAIGRIGKVIPLDDVLIDRAVVLQMNDLEDAIQAASAERASADVIVTRDLNDFVNSPVATIAPSAFLKLVAEK